MAKKGISLCARKGFTLVELLVAATIIGILMVFATNSYRNGVAETRWAQAKGNVDQLAAAVLRARIEYPTSAVFSSASIANTSTTGCVLNSGGVQNSTGWPPSSLIACGFLENGDWNSDYFQYYVCDKKTTNPCVNYSSEKPVACVGVRSDAKLPARYKSYKYCYYEAQGGKETLS